MVLLNDIVAGVKAAGAKSLKESIALPMAAYNSKEFHEMEIERILRPEWLLIGRVDQVEKPNSYLSIDLLGEALMLTRDAEGAVHVFSRVCPHRGMELLTGAGETPIFTCPYHAWLFDLSGACRRAPFMQDSDGFDLKDHSLTPVAFELWNGFVFVNLSGTAPPLGPQIAGLTERFKDLNLHDMVVAKTTDWGELAVDWKILLENAMECYHHVGTHAKSLQAIYPAELSWTEPGAEKFVITYAVAKSERKEDEVLETAEMLKRTTGEMITIFPITHFMVRSDGCSLLQIFPLGPGRIRMVTHVLLPRAVAQGPSAKEILEARAARSRKILGEDFDMCVGLQRMTTTNSTRVGRLSQLEEPLWDFYRFLAACI
ncbi:hypothetical protein BH09PSE5_BH09PSE5_16420 [soil metagenome]